MQHNWVRRTVLFLGGQTATLFGSMLVQYAITWHITLTTQSGVMLTIATLCGFLPQVFISLFAGVWADRHNRKHIIMLADAAIALCTAALAVLMLLGHTDLWLLFLIMGIRSLGAGVQTPAVSAFLTELVPTESLMKVNGIHASINGVMMLLGPVAAGALYAAMGIGATLWVDVATAAVGIGLLALLKTEPHAALSAGDAQLPADLWGGVRYVFRTKWLRQFTLFYVFFGLMFGPPVFLAPLMVARSFGPESWRLVAHEVAFACGSIVGGLLIGLVSKYVRNKVDLLIYGSLAFGLLTFVMGFSVHFWFYIAVMATVGLTMPFINSSSMTVLQTRVEPDVLGRVFGLVSIVGSSVMPLSMVFFGPLADRVSVELLLILTGLIMAVIALLALRLPVMRAAGEPLEETAANGNETPAMPTE